MSNTGINQIFLTDSQVNEFFEKGQKVSILQHDLRQNDYVILNTLKDLIGVYKVKGDKLIEIQKLTLKGETKFDKFVPLNLEQQCYFDLLNDDNIPIKIVTGIAGSGKTKSALKFAFHKLQDANNTIDKIMLVRNPVEVGAKVGYFKGDKNDKLAKWNNPVKDNLEYDNMDSLEEMVGKGIIEMEIPATMQGRDIKNTWIMVDECQQMTKEQIKMIGTRVAKGSQIVFLGDLDQTFLREFKENNGLKELYNLRGLEKVGCVNLIEDVRSEVSKIFALKY